MKPSGTPVASIILSELHTQLHYDGPTVFLAINGRGILAPGVQIPNEWWDRKRLVYHMEVDRPQVTAEGVLAVAFRCRCAPEHIEEMKDLVHAKIRELLEREIVPPLLIQLGMLSWRERDVEPLPPVTEPFGTPVDWGPPPVPMEGVEDLVLGAVAAHGMLASEQRVPRRPRVRVVDT